MAGNVQALTFGSPLYVLSRRTRK